MGRNSWSCSDNQRTEEESDNQCWAVWPRNSGWTWFFRSEENGLKLKEVYTDIDESKADGVVIYQDLEANAEVAKDSYINITINSLPTEKKGTVNVNVKSLLGGAVEYEEDGTTVKKVKLEIRVNDASIYSEEVNPLVESISAEFTNKGYVEIKVLIDGIKKGETGMYLEEQTSITID